MSETGLVQILEGALLAAGKPLSVAQISALFDDNDRPENTEIREALKEVAERCEDRGFELQEVASGFRFQVRQSLSTWVGRLWVERAPKYSRALLETLALVAYRQPITRGEIEEIRGVAVSTNIIKTLHEREWIRVVGHRDVPGRPAMYATTKQFLDYFSLKSLDQLPALAEIRDLETLNAELGFTEPLPEGMTSGESAPGLTVVGGTEHNPEDVSEDVSEETTEDTTENVSAGSEEYTSAEDSPQSEEQAAIAAFADDLEARAEQAEVDTDLDVDTTAEANSEPGIDAESDVEGTPSSELSSAESVKPESQA